MSAKFYVERHNKTAWAVKQVATPADKLVAVCAAHADAIAIRDRHSYFSAQPATKRRRHTNPRRASRARTAAAER